ncbi:BMP family lipoprotein [Candidatus Xianfuyuplasma coldseepsis]|uniref:BMP family ABC transporter substrate-binding protein n=1 Tax=Candidatus Xianfuyuplasma coldseepsis TaxID=2782163 RepID=A0A7L7KSU3_9MOLU|nr:BMP family ABC transporter substrate-binding protein [Xianfuyuplasma coldseepsis]QMS85813.1 BMP family ABC transporter substrate-binding protein [Xianfuyuplasma coldseepsis]
MKKLLLVFASFLFVFALAACNGTEEEATLEEFNSYFQIGLVTDTGGIDDKSFNQGTWEGVELFAETLMLPESAYRYVQSSSDADYIPNISAFSDEKLDLIVMPGFLFEDALIESAANYPAQKYLIIDMVVDAPNVASAVFAENEGSFLVGVAAALKAQEAGEDTVGFIGGMDFDLIQKFEAGFEAGVWAVDPTMTVLVDYAESFSDAAAGQALAVKQYGEGAYIIFHAAGGTGNGVINEAKSRRANDEDVWVIGVDKDQYEDGIYEGEMSAVLTSMMKRVDVAAYDVAVATYKGEFPGGEILVFDLSNDGVGLPLVNPNLSQAIVDQVATYKAGLLAGTYTAPTVPSRLDE